MKGTGPIYRIGMGVENVEAPLWYMGGCPPSRRPLSRSRAKQSPGHSAGAVVSIQSERIRLYLPLSRMEYLPGYLGRVLP